MKTALRLQLPWLLVALIAGCRSTPEPAPGSLPPPNVAAATFCFHGTPIAGPLPKADASSPSALPFEGTVSFFALTDLLDGSFEPLSLHTKSAILLRGKNPVSQIPRFTAGARLGIVDDLPAFLSELGEGKFGYYGPMVRLRASLDAGGTTVFQLQEKSNQQHLIPAEGLMRSAEVQIYYGTENEKPFRIALAVDDWIEPEPTDQAGQSEEEAEDPTPAPRDEKEPTVSSLQRELVLLDPETSNALRPVVIIFPSPFVGSPAEALVAVIEVSPGSGEANMDADLAQPIEEIFTWPLAAGELDEASESGADRAPKPPELGTDTENADWYGIEEVLRELPTSPQKRKALIYLASQTGAELTLDLCLSAPDALLFELAKRLSQEAKADIREDRAALGWMIDSSAFALLVERHAGPGLGWELEALLVRHTGELGRDATYLAETLGYVNGLEAFKAQIVHENLIFLEDRSPAARCRAFDWLEEKGRAPVGYDPLDTLEARRAALEGVFEEHQTENSGDTLQ